MDTFHTVITWFDSKYKNKRTRTFNRWPSGFFSILQMWVALLYNNISVYMLIIFQMLNGRPIIWRFICSLNLVSKFCFKQNFFDKKDLDCNYNPIYPTFFCWLLQFILLATIKIYEQQPLNTIIHFYICLQTFLCNLTITYSRYSVYKLLGKIEKSTFSTQICLKNEFRFGISKK